MICQENGFIFINSDNIVTEDLRKDYFLKIVYKKTDKWYIELQGVLTKTTVQTIS